MRPTAELQAIKTELAGSHPVSGPYSADNETAANQLNAPNRQPNRDTISGGDLAANVVKSEYTALSASDKAYFNMLVPAQVLPVTTQLRTEISALFPAGQTRTNLQNLLKRIGSRAEEIGLIGAVTSSDVADARRLP